LRSENSLGCSLLVANALRIIKIVLIIIPHPTQALTEKLAQKFSLDASIFFLFKFFK